jgi:aerobic-type carbon monoxide dehydrogenase small subunit (CoxS/CutS family)
MRVELTVNGETRAVEVEPRMSLLDCLRERLLACAAPAPCSWTAPRYAPA